ncbi:hypothetical protein WSM22_20930 [Cytophagales bacterium WSM2-2]|nr:hypothetical protein WSM22_20930 [Cytophagales bacterium WSM2-2]
MKRVSASFMLASVVLAFNLFLVSCKKDESKPKPVIASITPSSAYPGTDVTITGKNFKTDVNADIVLFAGTVATVTSATSTEIIATVPQGAISGKVFVSIDGNTAVSDTDFTVLQLHTVASFTPASGVAGTSVTITGTNFSATATDNTVKFNGTTAVVTAATATSLTVTVPLGATTGKISVSINNREASSTTDFTVPLPTITSFAPAYALAGATVTITGTNFANGSLTLNKVKINNTDATVTAATATQLTVTVPTATTGRIAVDVGGQSVTSAADFEVLIDIPRNGLVAFYPFKGNANDASGNNLHGTLGTSASQIPVPTADRFGKAGQAYDFDGVDDLITMGNPAALQISNQITLAGWFNIRAYKTSTLIMGMLSKTRIDNNGQFNGGYTMYFDFQPNQPNSFVTWPHLGTYDANHTYDFLGSVNTPSPIGTWVFLAMVVDGATMKVYQNNALKLTKNSNGGVAMLPDGAQGNLVLGVYGQTSSGFNYNGFMDDMTIYNRALTAAEVTQLYQQTVTKY